MKKIIKLIDYQFQHRHQLTKAYDDSNSMRYLSSNLDIYIIGRFDCSDIEFYIIKGENYSYTVILIPISWPNQSVLRFIVDHKPDIIHMHGNHIWKQYPMYAKEFTKSLPRTKKIFSGAAHSKGNSDFLSYFDRVIVNHKIQIPIMRCEPEKVIVKKRCSDPIIFYPRKEQRKIYDFVYVAGFIPWKRIDLMIDYVAKTPYNLVILGDPARKVNHYKFIVDYIRKNKLEQKVFLHDFLRQVEVPKFLAKCKVWVWPNSKPENPGTLTNRSVIEALACGMPLLVGKQAFKDTEFVRNGMNGWLYGDINDFRWKAENIIFNYKKMGKDSSIINEHNFNFKENFIDFYNDLYQNL